MFWLDPLHKSFAPNGEGTFTAPELMQLVRDLITQNRAVIDKMQFALKDLTNKSAKENQLGEGTSVMNFGNWFIYPEQRLSIRDLRMWEYVGVTQIIQDLFDSISKIELTSTICRSKVDAGRLNPGVIRILNPNLEIEQITWQDVEVIETELARHNLTEVCFAITQVKAYTSEGILTVEFFIPVTNQSDTGIAFYAHNDTLRIITQCFHPSGEPNYINAVLHAISMRDKVTLAIYMLMLISVSNRIEYDYEHDILD